MAAFAYSNSPYAIREDLPEAYRAAWHALASPGTWWNGAERIAIATETRRARLCQLCRTRKQALSPLAHGEANHDSDDALDAAVIDVVHRLTSDPSRLSQSWVEQVLGSQLSVGQYIEIISVVITVLCIDSFNDALGFTLEPLPEPLPGQPSRYVPDNLVAGIAWVPMIAQAAEAEADLWPGMKHPPNVIAALSAVPDAVRLLLQLSNAQYIPGYQVADPSADGGRAISRAQIEFIAARVSAINDCFY